jgi:uncharacterized surface protein with fasciclin (FAS1) repeats
MNDIKTFFRFILAIFLVMNLPSCEDTTVDFETEDDFGSIADYLAENQAKYSYFIQIAEATNMMHTFSSYNPHGNGYTLFLPSDEAFEGYFQDNPSYNNIADIIADKSFAWELIRYHILNMTIRTNDFPFGAFPDTTLSGDLLTVGFTNNIDSTVYLINNQAPVILRNVEARNGFIHEIGQVLEPIVFTGYELLSINTDYSILTELFELTGLNKKMGLYVSGENREVENQYTILAEPDTIYHKHGFFSVQDVIEFLNPASDNYTSKDNPVYQFAAYHVLEGRYFLDNFEGSTNYNTFASLPVRIGAGLQIKINSNPNRVFDTLVDNNDTTLIDYIEPFYNASNVLSQNGPIHFINQVMELYKPGLSIQTFQFFEEPVINNIRNRPNEYIFEDQDEFSIISWEGVDELIYFKSGTGIQANANDYLRIDGDFNLRYEIPKILPGTYQVIFRANAFGDDHAVVELYIDGNKTGGNMNLTSSGNSNGNPYNSFNQNTVEFTEYETHLIEVRSLIPGIMMWDFIQFEPV